MRSRKCTSNSSSGTGVWMPADNISFRQSAIDDSRSNISIRVNGVCLRLPLPDPPLPDPVFESVHKLIFYRRRFLRRSHQIKRSDIESHDHEVEPRDDDGFRHIPDEDLRDTGYEPDDRQDAQDPGFLPIAANNRTAAIIPRKKIGAKRMIR